MNKHVHPIFADIINSFAINQYKQTQDLRSDMWIHQDKLNDGPAKREADKALQLQNKYPPLTSL